MRKYLFISVLLVAVGCNKELQKPVGVTYSAESKAIAASMEESSVGDTEIMYKQFSGLVSFIRNSKRGFSSTVQMEKVIESFHEEYEYELKNQEFTSALNKFMKERGYENPKKIDGIEISKEQVAKDMETIANGIRLALEKKKKSD